MPSHSDVQLQAFIYIVIYISDNCSLHKNTLTIDFWLVILIMSSTLETCLATYMAGNQFL